VLRLVYLKLKSKNNVVNILPKWARFILADAPFTFSRGFIGGAGGAGGALSITFQIDTTLYITLRENVKGLLCMVIGHEGK